jgi:general secretion pathway protein A
VIVDEAQSLSLDVLEQLHLLSSLEIDGQKLLEVILIGEPSLIELLARAARHRLAQSTGYQLVPFTENETCAYVRHRPRPAGAVRSSTSSCS